MHYINTSLQTETYSRADTEHNSDSIPKEENTYYISCMCKNKNKELLLFHKFYYYLLNTRVRYHILKFIIAPCPCTPLCRPTPPETDITPPTTDSKGNIHPNPKPLIVFVVSITRISLSLDHCFT